MPAKKLTDFLDSNNVRYIAIRHSPAFTAQEVAASAHVSGKELAKTVVVKIDGRVAMAVLPATAKIDFDRLKQAAGTEKAELAREDEFKSLFPDCEIGGMPPFGNLYGLEVYSENKLAEDREIAFNAGSHSELIRMPYKDFERLVHPKIVKLTD